MPPTHADDRNRDDQLKPGSPPRSATEPSGGGVRSNKTATDPSSGAPNTGAPTPNRAKADQIDGIDGKPAR